MSALPSCGTGSKGARTAPRRKCRQVIIPQTAGSVQRGLSHAQRYLRRDFAWNWPGLTIARATFRRRGQFGHLTIHRPRGEMSREDAAVPVAKFDRRDALMAHPPDVFPDA